MCFVPSDTEEFNYRFRVLFSERIKGFIEGELVKKWEKKLGQVPNEIVKLDALLRKPKKYATHMELWKNKEGFVRDKTLIGRRIAEFKSGMECILDYVNGKVLDTSDVKVLKLKGNVVARLTKALAFLKELIEVPVVVILIYTFFRKDKNQSSFIFKDYICKQ
ncbi:hypothetical protein L2E82_27584 [Cichorium intybus]|uniref:Uncharacterized protein n=1 Tax=Cichorium intybus TaxID=13427 RepID=A0ACB9CU09_CICIN|nr:hypothetical protein L2E82_27584 [Cichorium intybus]